MANNADAINTGLKDYVNKAIDNGYVPVGEPIDWEQNMPMAPKDQVSFGTTPTGLPQDWNYKTSRTGPNGEALPKGAIGWTPQGEAFYGGASAFGNWMNGIQARTLNTPLRSNELWGSQKEGDAPEWYNIPFRAAAEVGKGVLETFQLLGEQVEQVRGGLQESGEAVGLEEDAIGKWLKQTAQESKEGGSRFTWIEAMAYSINPVGLIWDITRGAAGLLSGKTEEFSEGYQAGRVLYSGVIDPMLKEDYVRRLRAGENPYLIAQEIQNPGAELAGQLLADPTTLLGWALKAAKATGIIEDGVKALGTIEDAGLAARFAENAASESAKITQAADVATETARWLTNKSTNFSENISKVGWQSLTVEGQRAGLGMKTSRIVSLIGNTVQKFGGNYVERTMDVLHGGWLMASGKSEDIIKGSAALLHYLPKEVVYSSEMGDFYVALRKLVPDAADAEKLLKTVGEAKNIPELVGAFSKKMDGLAESLIPKLGARAAALDKAATGAELTAREAELVKLGDIGDKGRAILRFENIAHSSVVRGINKFYGIVYMGVSPGYLARNVLNNTFTIFVDRGAGAAIDYLRPSGAAQKLDNLKAMGGWTPEVEAAFGPAASAAGVDLNKKSFWTIITRASNKMEGKASVILYHDGFVDTMNKAVKASLAQHAGEMAADGIDVRMWQRLLINNNYNELSAVRAYKDAVASGSVDIFKSNLWMEAAEETALRKYGWYDDYVKAMSQVDPSDLAAKQAINSEFFEKNVKAFAAEAAKEPVIPNPAKADFVDEATLGGDVAEDINQARHIQSRANDKAETAYLMAVHNSLDTAKRAGIDVAPLFEKHPEYASLVESMGAENLLETYLSAWKKTWQGRFNLYRSYFPFGKSASVKNADWVAVAKELGVQNVEGIVDKNTLIERFWSEYFPQAGAHFQQGREAYVKLAQQFLDEIGGLDKRLVAESDLAKAETFIEYAREVDGVRVVGENGELATRTGKAVGYVPHASYGETPTLARAHAEGLEGLRITFDNLKEQLAVTHNARQPVVAPSLQDALTKWEKVWGDNLTTARFVGSKVGKHYRDFGILDYTKKNNLNTALGLVYPYHYWYSGTYKNWLTRLATDAGVVSAYAKYRDYMSEIHAGLPDWWKYNLNTDELLGIQTDHPLFFNLEQTINPLNGLTGTDFNDPYKTVDWWTRTLDNMSKIGPSTWSPLSIATAFALYLKGEKDAAARWSGRLFPQSSTIESLGALAGLDPFTADPNVYLFSGGTDPYTERRINRALAAMVEDGKITNDQAIDAGYTKTGDIWEDAWRRAVSERAPGQLSSFFLGAGFKARSASDLQIDKFYQDYNKIYNMRSNMSSGEYSQTMEQLRQHYPFMDSLLLANKQDEKRDAALAYNVLNRIPPSGSSLAETAGISQEMLSKFYDTKGDWSQWSQTDKDRFMAGIVDMSAILATPDAATREEWLNAKNQYKQIGVTLEMLFGQSITAKIETYFQIKAASPDQADIYLASNPAVEQALDFKAQAIVSNPLLGAYYGGIEKIVNYYRGVMYAEAEKKFGSDIFDVQTEYYRLVDLGEKRAAAAYKKQHPELALYWTYKNDYEDKYIFAQVSALAAKLPEAKPAQVRPDANASSSGAEGVLSQIQSPTQQSIPPEYITGFLGESGTALVIDYLVSGQPMPPSVQNKITAIAEQAGISEEEVLQLISDSLGVLAR